MYLNTVLSALGRMSIQIFVCIVCFEYNLILLFEKKKRSLCQGQNAGNYVKS